MLDSSTKHPENRIHLYDPVGLINDNYGNYKQSNYTIKPRRQTVSYDNFLDSKTINNNNNLSLRSFNSVTDGNNNGGLRSFDSFEVDSFNLRSYSDKISSESINGGRVSSSERNDGGLRFVVGESNRVEDDQLDAPTPRLWRPSSVKTNSSLNQSNNIPKSVNFSINSLNSSYQNTSVNSRTQAIAKGRKELMDMVKDLPETFYELSLKDIVEQNSVEIEIPVEKNAVREVNGSKDNDKETKLEKKSSKKVKKSESKKKMVRSRSVDNGKFLLKTSVFPILGSRKSKKSMNSANSFKVAPMPKSDQGKGGEKEWWRRKSCMPSESDGSNGLSSQSSNSSRSSSSSSSKSNNGNGRRSNKFFISCCIFNGKRVEAKK